MTGHRGVAESQNVLLWLGQRWITAGLSAIHCLLFQITPFIRHGWFLLERGKAVRRRRGADSGNSDGLRGMVMPTENRFPVILAWSAMSDVHKSGRLHVIGRWLVVRVIRFWRCRCWMKHHGHTLDNHAQVDICQSLWWCRDCDCGRGNTRGGTLNDGAVVEKMGAFFQDWSGNTNGRDNEKASRMRSAAALSTGPRTKTLCGIVCVGGRFHGFGDGQPSAPLRWRLVSAGLERWRWCHFGMPCTPVSVEVFALVFMKNVAASTRLSTVSELTFFFPQIGVGKVMRTKLKANCQLHHALMIRECTVSAAKPAPPCSDLTLKQWG